MIKMNHMATVLLLASIFVAHAETANQPVSQGATSVNNNLSNNPDNKGLQEASERLKENEAKVAEKRAEADKRAGDAKHRKDKEEKHERMEKREHEKMERYERMEHHGKMERPAKPERPGR